jgi:hypothetical protein
MATLALGSNADLTHLPRAIDVQDYIVQFGLFTEKAASAMKQILTSAET